MKRDKRERVWESEKLMTRTLLKLCRIYFPIKLDHNPKQTSVIAQLREKEREKGENCFAPNLLKT